MTLIYCPECGNEISGKASRCSYCGCPIIKSVTENSYSEKESKDYTKIAAQVEKKTIESRLTRGNHVAGITAVILGIFSLWGGTMRGGGFLLVSGGLFFLMIGVTSLYSENKDKKRVQHLQNILDEKKKS